MYSSKFAGFHQKLFFEIARNPSVYAALSDVCVIITRASILLTIPVAFILKIPFFHDTLFSIYIPCRDFMDRSFRSLPSMAKVVSVSTEFLFSGNSQFFASKTITCMPIQPCFSAKHRTMPGLCRYPEATWKMFLYIQNTGTEAEVLTSASVPVYGRKPS